MAKTPEQKAATKEASLLKKAAHSARNRELCEAEEMARSTAESTPLAQEYEAAQKAEEESRGLRKTLVAEVEVQIALLRERIEAINAEHSPQIERLEALRRQAAESKRAESSRLLEEAQSRFPDMQSDMRWSSVPWVPPEGYIEQFAAEHAEDMARKKAQREAKAEKSQPCEEAT